MNKEHKEILRKNRKFIKENLHNADEVVDKLYEKGRLTLNMKEEILSESKPARVYKLLDIIKTRGSAAFEDLIDSLKETENSEVAEKLTDGGTGSTPRNANYTSYPVSVLKQNLPGNRTTETPSGAPKKSPEGATVNVPPPHDSWLEKIDSKKLADELVKTEEDFVKKMMVTYEENMYKMNGNREKKGKCLTFVNLRFPQEYSECKSSFDTGKWNMQQTFKLLGFKWINCHSACEKGKMEDIKKMVCDEMKKSDMADYGCFCVICITTGANPENIYSKEGDHISIQEMEELLGSCEQIMNKPKILMVHTVPVSSLICSHPGRKPKNIPEVELSDKMAAMTVGDYRAPPSDSLDRNVFVVSIELLRGFSFLIKHRNVSGSYFMSALIYTLLKHSSVMSFPEMMEEMNNLLGETYHDTSSDNVDAQTGSQADLRCIRVAVVTLLKKGSKELFIFPGYQDGGTQATS